MTGEARFGGIDHGHDPQRRGCGLFDHKRPGRRGAGQHAGRRAGALSAPHDIIASNGQAGGRRTSAASIGVRPQQIRS